MAWVYLVVAGIFEVVWAISLKYTAGFTRLWPSVMTVAGMAASFYFLSMAIKNIADRHRLRGMDRNRGVWGGCHWHAIFK